MVQRHAISRTFMYESEHDRSERFTVFRQGGNRMTGYNWGKQFSMPVPILVP
jgi:hypothetical protein